MSYRRTNGSWSGRAMALGTTGFATAVMLIMVLAPASASLVNRSTVLTPAYKGTVTQASTYLSTYGCGKAKATPAKWNAKTGLITGSDSASGATCGKSLGYVGGSGSGDGESGIEVAIPFHAAHNGNNSIGSSWSVSIASSSSYSAGVCPAKNINYHPALYAYSYAYCEAGISTEFEIFVQLQDLQNSSWHGNFSEGYSYNDTYFENYTECYNYGTPTCYNGTSGSYHYAYGLNAPGFSAFTMNGATSFSLWNNGTNMVRAHHYVMVVEIYIYADAYAEQANLLGHWSGSAVASVNMATLGNGATLNSITIA
jgi:hypothetical protein